MKKLDIYLIKHIEPLQDGYQVVSAYTDHDQAEKACRELNRRSEKLEEDFRRLEEEFGIDYDHTNEEVFNRYLKEKDPSLLAKIEEINAIETDLCSEDYAALDAYEDGFDGFLSLGEETYRKYASECGYSEEVINLLISGIEYSKAVTSGFYYASLQPVTLHISEES